jgi:hypothetical protein
MGPLRWGWVRGGEVAVWTRWSLNTNGRVHTLRVQDSSAGEVVWKSLSSQILNQWLQFSNITKCGCHSHVVPWHALAYTEFKTLSLKLHG